MTVRAPKKRQSSRTHRVRCLRSAARRHPRRAPGARHTAALQGSARALRVGPQPAARGADAAGGRRPRHPRRSQRLSRRAGLAGRARRSGDDLVRARSPRDPSVDREGRRSLGGQHQGPVQGTVEAAHADARRARSIPTGSRTTSPFTSPSTPRAARRRSCGSAGCCPSGSRATGGCGRSVRTRGISRKEHEDLCRAVLKRDTAAAVAALRKHRTTTIQDLLADWNES